jgi:glycosyltransferase involved in cell wall biosynthesis
MAVNSAAPLVSVIVPCYNQGRFLADALESIRCQTHGSIESIVVDDGSTDGTAANAAAAPWSRYVHQRNGGTAAARNTGLAHSHGEFVVFLDADDRLLPHAIETALAALSSHPEWGFVTGHVQLISENGSVLGVPPQPHADPATYFDLLRSNYIWSPGVVTYRRGILGSAPFRAAAGGSADVDLNLRLALRGEFGCHHRVVLEYRQHGANMTGNPRYMLSSAIRVRRAQYRHVRTSVEGRRALAEGIAVVRADFGEQVVQQVKASVRSPHRWWQALAGLICLLRYHPGGIGGLLRAALAGLRRVGPR